MEDYLDQELTALEVLEMVASRSIAAHPDWPTDRIAADIALEYPAARLRGALCQLMMSAGWLAGRMSSHTPIDPDLAIEIDRILRSALDDDVDR